MATAPDPTNEAGNTADPPGHATNPPGLRAQIAAVIAAVRRVATAHVELAKAEAGEILDEVPAVAQRELGPAAVALQNLARTVAARMSVRAASGAGQPVLTIS